jgi:hypothetical protein
MTPSGIEPATFRFVAQYLNHCATISGPTCISLDYLNLLNIFDGCILRPLQTWSIIPVTWRLATLVCIRVQYFVFYQVWVTLNEILRSALSWEVALRVVVILRKFWDKLSVSSARVSLACSKNKVGMPEREFRDSNSVINAINSFVALTQQVKVSCTFGLEA